MAIVDGHVHIADEREADGRPCLDAETLLKLMDGPFEINGEPRIIDWALAQPTILPTRQGDPMDHHSYVADQVARYPDRLAGCFVANPVLDLDRTLEVMRNLVETRGFRAVKLHPTIHGYVPFRTRDQLDPIIDEARRLGIIVIVHQGDPPFAYPTQMVPLIKNFPDVRFVLAHFGTQRMVMANEAIYVAVENDNVFLETGWGALPRIKEGIDALGPERLLFGSDCPIQEIGSQLRTLEVLGWEPPLGISLDPRKVEGIMGDNLTSLLTETAAL